VVAGYGRGGEEEAAPVEGGERRRRRLRDIRSHAEEVAGRARVLGCQKPEVEYDAGGPDQAGLGHAGRVTTRPKGLFELKNESKRKTGCRTILSNFSNKDLILKAKDSNTFKPNLNWNQTRIN
jgi:hypothetical protein